MFELSYESLADEKLGSWKAAVVSWDSETFGFNVAILQAPNLPEGISVKAIRHAIVSYAQSHQVSMIITGVPGDCHSLILLLQKAGFIHVDIALSIQFEMADFPDKPGRILLQEAKTHEVQIAADIAGRAFAHGRYHQDCSIPAELANKRYMDWVLRTQMDTNPQQLLIARYEGGICGFAIVEQKGREGYLHLIALAPEYRGKGLACELIGMSLAYLKSGGSECVMSKVSASNTAALNMYAAAGAAFIKSENLLHWHAFQE